MIRNLFFNFFLRVKYMTFLNIIPMQHLYNSRKIVSLGGRHVRLGTYKHYKGNLYKITGLCTHTETNEELVFYQSLYDKYEFWVRPIEIFFSDVEFENKLQPRFSFVE